MQQQVARAGEYYARASTLEERVDAPSRSSLQAMTSIYQALLNKVGQMGVSVLKKRARLSTVEKLRLAGKTLLGSKA